MLSARAFTKWIAAGLLCVGGSALRAQKTFDEYFKMVKEQKIGAREAAFLKECGVNPDDAIPTYGVRLGAIRAEKWSPRDMLGPGRKEGFDDYYTAEIRGVESKPRFVSTWWITRETGETQNAMFCFGDEGKVKSAVTLNIYNPPPTSQGRATRYIRQQKLTPSGRVTEDYGTFVDAEDTPITAPALSKDDLNAAQTSGLPLMAYEAIRDLWGKHTGPTIVPYEQPQLTTPKTTPKR